MKHLPDLFFQIYVATEALIWRTFWCDNETSINKQCTKVIFIGNTWGTMNLAIGPRYALRLNWYRPRRRVGCTVFLIGETEIIGLFANCHILWYSDVDPLAGLQWRNSQYRTLPMSNCLWLGRFTLHVMHVWEAHQCVTVCLMTCRWWSGQGVQVAAWQRTLPVTWPMNDHTVAVWSAWWEPIYTLVHSSVTSVSVSSCCCISGRTRWDSSVSCEYTFIIIIIIYQ